MGRVLRIAVGGISLESNDFVAFTAGLGEFVDAGFLLEGDAVLGLAGNATELGGALAVLGAQTDVAVVPLLAARGVSSGRLSAETYADLRNRLLGPLREVSGVDGVFLFTHGSMEA